VSEVSAPAQVPLTDLRLGGELEQQILADIADVVQRGAFSNGAEVAVFEEAFARYCGSRHCVGVASGLDALRLALVAAELQAGDEVIVPAHTFAATLEAVIQAGGRPIIVDVDDSDFNIDSRAVEVAITPKTRFVIPVHLYGQLADLASLRAIAQKNRLEIIEDACQAHGATRAGLRAGTAGLAGAFSFYPTKNLGAFGDGGALVTRDPEIAARARALREHGQSRKYEHTYVGYTARLDTIQAAVLLRKLTFLDRWNDERRAAARFYGEHLIGVGDLRLPAVASASEPVWHLYVARTKHPARLATFLQARGVATGRHYPRPLHMEPAFAALGYRRGDFPVTEQLASEVISLPLFPGISEQQMYVTVGAISEYFDAYAATPTVRKPLNRAYPHE
jgi:dTDP-4-amino-4,6-dideoxygalactose transaminase